MEHGLSWEFWECECVTCYLLRFSVALLLRFGLRWPGRPSLVPFPVISLIELWGACGGVGCPWHVDGWFLCVAGQGCWARWRLCTAWHTSS